MLQVAVGSRLPSPSRSVLVVLRGGDQALPLHPHHGGGRPGITSTRRWIGAVDEAVASAHVGVTRLCSRAAINTGEELKPKKRGELAVLTGH